MKQNRVEVIFVLPSPRKWFTRAGWGPLILLSTVAVLGCNGGDPEIDGIDSTLAEAVVVASSQSIESGPDSDELDSQEKFEELFGGTIYEGLDFNVIGGYEGIEALNHEWHGAVSEWKELYMSFWEKDSFEHFERESKPGIVEMERILKDHELEVAKVPAGKYRDMIEEENLRIRGSYFAAYQGIHQAVVNLDHEAESYWLAQFDVISSQEEKLGYLVIEKMREAVRINPELSHFFENEIQEAEELMSILYPH